jgi:RNA polymerase sigma-70 factor (ECF subfamily)
MTEEERARVEAFEAVRPRLFGIAYRMLGVRAEAEDVVQDAWLRLSRTPRVRSLEGFLVRTTTRLCLDRSTSARARRESYVGLWLPEPLPDEDTAAHEVEHLESLTMAMLHVIGRLGPLERAVFLLREAFDYGYREIGELVDRRPDACRQIAHRARRRVREEGSGSVDADEHQALLRAFLQAARAGEVSRLEELLTDDAVLISDGGGKAVSALNPVQGPDRVARFLVGITRGAPPSTTVELRRLNGLPAAVVHMEGAVAATFCLQVQEGRIRRIFSVRNPEKLEGLQATPGETDG